MLMKTRKYVHYIVVDDKEKRIRKPGLDWLAAAQFQHMDINMGYGVKNYWCAPIPQKKHRPFLCWAAHTKYKLPRFPFEQAVYRQSEKTYLAVA